MFLSYNKRGQSKVVQTVLIVFVAVFAVAIIGVLVIDNSRKTEDSLVIQSCKNMYLFDDDAFKRCVIEELGIEKAIELFGKEGIGEFEDGADEGDGGGPGDQSPDWSENPSPTYRFKIPTMVNVVRDGAILYADPTEKDGGEGFSVPLNTRCQIGNNLSIRGQDFGWEVREMPVINYWYVYCFGESGADWSEATGWIAEPAIENVVSGKQNPVYRISNMNDDDWTQELSFDFEYLASGADISSLIVDVYSSNGNSQIVKHRFNPNLRSGSNEKVTVYHLFDFVSSVILTPMYVNGSNASSIRFVLYSNGANWEAADCQARVKNGIVGCYNFDLGFVDYSLGSNTGIGMGGIENVYLPGGNFIGVFDGYNDYIEIPSSDNLKFEDMGIQFWIKTQEMQSVWNNYSKYGVQQILRKGDKINDDFGLSIQAESLENSKWDIIYKDSNCELLFSDANIPTDKEWHNIGVSRGGDKTIMVYVDGILKEQKKCPVDFIKGNGNLYIGAYASSEKDNKMFNGLIDDLLIYNRELPSNEIGVNYAVSRTNFENEDANSYSNILNNNAGNSDGGSMASTPDTDLTNVVRKAGTIVTLEWDPSPDAWVFGYHIYQEWREFDSEGNMITDSYRKEGVVSVPFGVNTANVITRPGPNWFTATAYTADGLESNESNEVTAMGAFHLDVASAIDLENFPHEKYFLISLEIHKDFRNALNAYILEQSIDLNEWNVVPMRIEDYLEEEPIGNILRLKYKAYFHRDKRVRYYRLHEEFPLQTSHPLP